MHGSIAYNVNRRYLQWILFTISVYTYSVGRKGRTRKEDGGRIMMIMRTEVNELAAEIRMVPLAEEQRYRTWSLTEDGHWEVR